MADVEINEGLESVEVVIHCGDCGEEIERETFTGTTMQGDARELAEWWEGREEHDCDDDEDEE